MFSSENWTTESLNNDICYSSTGSTTVLKVLYTAKCSLNTGSSEVFIDLYSNVVGVNALPQYWIANINPGLERNVSFEIESCKLVPQRKARICTAQWYVAYLWHFALQFNRVLV